MLYGLMFMRYDENRLRNAKFLSGNNRSFLISVKLLLSLLVLIRLMFERFDRNSLP